MNKGSDHGEGALSQGDVPIAGSPAERLATAPVVWRVRRAVKAVCRGAIAEAGRGRLIQAELLCELARNTLATRVPGLIIPSPRFLTIAITARCNFRCLGCRYGRDYMPGAELPTDVVLKALSDAARAGVSSVRLYGGEPLIHRGLPQMVRECVSLGMTPFVSTNGSMLSEQIVKLVGEGLRILTFGCYGSDHLYDSYVGRRGAWTDFCAMLDQVRHRYGQTLTLRLSFLLDTRTCNPHELEMAWALATRFDLRFHVDLVHYSLPYFSEGPEGELQFRDADAGRIQEFVRQLRVLRRQRPDLYREPVASIRSIPDWLLQGPRMKVPCDAYNMIWIGADGSVRLCFVTFPLGNLHEQRLSAILFTKAHRDACQRAFRLDCPNCHCGRDMRIVKSAEHLWRYSRVPDVDSVTT